MAGEHLSPADVREMLRAACTRAGSRQAWADQNGLSLRMVEDAMKTKRSIPQSIFGPLGLERVMVYRRRTG